jgi:hypothetical protein
MRGRLPVTARTILLVSHVESPLAIMTFSAEITLGKLCHVHFVRSLRHLEELIMTVAASEGLLIYVLFMAEEHRRGILGRECYITAADLLCDGTHRKQEACHDCNIDKHLFHGHHLLIRIFAQ